MSKGTPFVSVRVPDDLLQQIEQEIARTNQNTRNAPFTRSSWILVAIREKLAHAKRSRQKKKKKPGPIIPANNSPE